MMFVAITVGILLMVIILAFALKLSLFKRIQVLMEGTERIECGDIKLIEADLAGDAIGKLDNSFNAIAAELQYSINRLEEEKLSLDDKVRERTKELEVARENAIASTKSKSEFLAIMSHEIRTPMNGVLGMVQLLEATELSGLQREYLTVLASSGKSLLTIINDILDFSRIEANQMELEAIDFNLEKLCYEVCKTMMIQATAKDVELILHYDADSPRMIKGDIVRIRQILVNFVGNAIKFTQKGYVIVQAVVTEMDEENVNIDCKVIDTGIGLSVEQQKKIFNKFTQADTSTIRKYGGTGLGLSICNKLISLMDGEIGVRSKLGLGATFWFRLTLPRVGVIKIISKKSLLSSNVMVISGNQVNLSIIRSMLEKFGTEVTSIQDPRSVISLLKQAALSGKPFDLILTDSQMSYMEGEELVQLVRKDEKICQVAIIIMTSYYEGSVSGYAEKIGINGILQKPIITEQLYDMMKSVLGSMEKREVRKQPFISAKKLSGWVSGD